MDAFAALAIRYSLQVAVVVAAAAAGAWALDRAPAALRLAAWRLVRSFVFCCLSRLLPS